MSKSIMKGKSLAVLALLGLAATTQASLFDQWFEQGKINVSIDSKLINY